MATHDTSLSIYLGRYVKPMKFHEPLAISAVDSTSKTVIFKGTDSKGHFHAVSAYLTEDLLMDGKLYPAHAWPHQNGMKLKPKHHW